MGAKRVEGPGRVVENSSSSSSVLGASFCSCCCCWALLVVVAAGGASLRDTDRERVRVRERERALVREREKRKTEGRRVGWDGGPGPVLRSNWEMGASFWTSKVGLWYLSGSYRNFVIWAFFLFGFGFHFSFFFLFSEERNATNTDRLTDRPADIPPTNPMNGMDGWMNR